MHRHLLKAFMASQVRRTCNWDFHDIRGMPWRSWKKSHSLSKGNLPHSFPSHANIGNFIQEPSCTGGRMTLWRIGLLKGRFFPLPFSSLSFTSHQWGSQHTYLAVSFNTGSALILLTKKRWLVLFVGHLKLFAILCILPKLISCQMQKP
jgi:hypothetical protein